MPHDDLPNWTQWYAAARPIPADAPFADTRAISTGLLETLGVRLIEGRFFTDADQDPGNPVAIIDEMLAKQLWPDRGAIGQRFVSRAGTQETQPTVVGVIAHLKLRSLTDTLAPQIYVPWRIARRNPIAFVLRTNKTPAELVGAIRAAVAGADPRLPIYDVRPLAEYVDAARSVRRFAMVLATAFAASAVLLACLGVYGFLAHAVAVRRHEFGVRRALGAQTRQVMREVVREGLVYPLAGLLGGLASAAIAGRLIQSQLYGVHPHDPITYAAASSSLVRSSHAGFQSIARRQSARWTH